MKRVYAKLKRLIRRDTRDASSPSSPSSSSTKNRLKTARPPSPPAPAKQADAPLESLPPEVRHHLLASLDFQQCHSLVHASPVYHQQFLSGRKLLLYPLLENTLGGAALDAWAAFRAGSARVSGRLTHGKALGHLERYQERRSSDANFSIRQEDLTEDDLAFMTRFHCLIVAPLVQRCAHRALSNLAAESTAEHKDKEVPSTEQMNIEDLSQTELTRLQRSLYRFQLCCSLFGASRLTAPGVTGRNFEAEEILVHFLGLFEPWEIEKIGCIYFFAKEKYEKIFRAIKWDVDPMNPKFEDERPPTPTGAFDFNNTWLCESLLEGTISRGLELLNSVFDIDNHDQLVATMQEQLTSPGGRDFLDDYGAWSDSAQSSRRRQHPSEGDAKTQRKDPMPFQGDNDSSPPIGWTTTWRETYSNLLGPSVPECFRRFGYVFWDVPRMESTGARDVITKKCEAAWGDDYYDDPRDWLL
ncbi:Uncharacterized protein TPAR_03953 [Tolypocladium paradoxum]|uniref:Uncharacterized protein n=1 Tax=Tolypocladium paradoxum TaxID=94208 RepID=A0A2S4L074_9HYPO|nr:Uncharacterized protein TPAR_03953 [Tolypocladium paradoxum]